MSIPGNLTYDNTTGNVLINTTATSYPYTTINTTSYPYAIGVASVPYNTYYNNYNYNINPLKNLFYNINFELDKDNLLSFNIKRINKNKMSFECKYDGNRIQPYELIMKLIQEKKKFTVKVKVSDILTITYINFQFKEIINNLNFSTDCDFSLLKVRFKYDEILYENHKLSDKELRSDKLKKIMETNE